MTGIDLNCPEFFQNPYPIYRRIRENGGVLWLPHTQPTTQPGVWLFARHADALAIFKETTAISKTIARVRPPGRTGPFDTHMLHRDAPDHLRLRRLVGDYFSTTALATLKTRIAAIAGELIDAMSGSAPFDLMADFARLLPSRVIADVLGVPDADMPRIRTWSHALGDSFDSVTVTPELHARNRQALAEFHHYTDTLANARQRQPAGDLLTHLVAAEGRGEIRRDEVIGMVELLLFAGHEPPINLLGNALWLLLTHRDEWHHLATHPDALPDAIEEILRFESPEQRTSFRLTLAPLELGGHRLEAGQQLGVFIGSANRDETEFPDPDRFDIARTPYRHVAFGFGIHQCMGQHMARMEARIALALLLERCPALRLCAETPVWRRNSFFRGLAALPALN